MELKIFGEKGDISQIFTKVHVRGLGSMPMVCAPVAAQKTSSGGAPSGPTPHPFWARCPGWEGAGIPALSPWHLIKCHFSLQLCAPSQSSPVLVSSGQPLQVSMSHRATPSAPVLLTVGQRIPFITSSQELRSLVAGTVCAQ